MFAEKKFGLLILGSVIYITRKAIILSFPNFPTHPNSSLKSDLYQRVSISNVARGS